MQIKKILLIKSDSLRIKYNKNQKMILNLRQLLQKKIFIIKSKILQIIIKKTIMI